MNEDNIARHQGGRLAANFRRANVAEGIGIQMLRPFAAVAPVPREEDHGIDIVATLLRREGTVLIADSSFLVQIKTHSAAEFLFAGDGIKWLRMLRLPYFPMVVNLSEGFAALYTLNPHLLPIHAAAIDRINFCVPTSGSDCDGLDDFPLETPLMQWSLADCGHEAFPTWAWTILKAAVDIETTNVQTGPMWRFTSMIGGPYIFDRSNPVVQMPPKPGHVTEIPIGNPDVILTALRNLIGPFAGWAINQNFPDDRSDELLKLKSAFRKLGFDPDPDNE